MNESEEEYRSLIDPPRGGQEIKWESSKEDQWALLESKMSAPRAKRVFLSPVLRYAIAASVVLILAFTAFLRFYSEDFSTTFGQQQTLTLPDGSTVKLNAGSQLSYHPYWWKMSREVKLEGEGYFEVQSGNTFTVSSNLGSTTVLGTKFNVYARNERYRVSCYEGSVQVVNKNGSQAVIQPNQKAVGVSGALRVQDINSGDSEKTWKDNYFLFTSAGIDEVIEEFERQYNITIEYHGEKLLYTGNFPRGEDVDQTLSIVSLSLNLQLEKKDSATYTLK